MERLKIAIQGRVQGVGFRPCVHAIARQLGLTGWVKNNAYGVLIEIQGERVLSFTQQLTHHLPPLALIRSIQQDKIPVVQGDLLFAIHLSDNQDAANTIISPDTCVCSACLHELFDAGSRYFRYPFLNCTQCGPRLSITEALPYDRDKTSMKPFPLCEGCQQDYLDPENRRYHAQPTACTRCGPHLSMPIEAVAKRILLGEIVALKGLGGYQLIADARNERVLLRLRQRKNREGKPFALMLANLASVNSMAECDADAAHLLESSVRPIVLLKKKKNLLSDLVAPGLNEFGFMLPYTPIHYLLFNAFAGGPNGLEWLQEQQSVILVVTSANLGGNPLMIDDTEACVELEEIADRVVSYNRAIVTRADDSVTRMIHNKPMLIRRARGYVPNPIPLVNALPPTLAVGGHLKNTFCVTRGDEAFVSQHIGSLNNKASIEFFHDSLTYWLSFLNVKPERIIHDLHPDFYTSVWAKEQELPAFAVQHHHAHLASVMAEHGVEGRVLGLALDGYGYGLNGQSWGGELFLLDGEVSQRIGSFYPLFQPGGEMAVHEPWRMAVSLLHALDLKDEVDAHFPDFKQAKALYTVLEKQINTLKTSSCGRLFDAVSALLGVRTVSQYEGQAAMQLEALVTEPEVYPHGWRISENFFDLRPVLNYLVTLKDPVLGANVFHGTLIAGLADWVLGVCCETKRNQVILSGGCFLNRILAEGLVAKLKNVGVTALLPRLLPPNDGGLSLGQAWVGGKL